MKKLNFQEKAFVSLYVDSFNARQSALDAGYAVSVATVHAHRWVSLTSHPKNKRHVYESVRKAINKQYGEELVDSKWVLRRAKQLADFNISKFVTNDDEGKAVYDFSDATDDDWYCISEYTVDHLTKAGADDDTYNVERIKIKGHCKLRALELVGKHVDVQAFTERIEHSGEVIQIVMTADEYKKARQEMLDEDDC